MLEQQQGQLVAGVRELYHLLRTGRGWPGAPLQEALGGHPLTHDILERLGVLHSAGESNSNCEGFEEDINEIKRRLFKTDTIHPRTDRVRLGTGTIRPEIEAMHPGTGAMQSRSRASTSSDSEPGFASSSSSIQTPPLQPVQFSNPFTQKVAPPTPQSPTQSQSQLSSPLKDFRLVMPSITHAELNPANFVRSPWVTMVPSMDDPFPSFGYDRPVDMDGSLLFNGFPSTTNSPFQMTDFTMHDVDFSDFAPS